MGVGHRISQSGLRMMLQIAVENLFLHVFFIIDSILKNMKLTSANAYIYILYIYIYIYIFNAIKYDGKL